MAFEKYEESEDVIDWEWLDNQPEWFRRDVVRGKQEPKLKKRIRREKKDAEKKHRD
jgi:hypothetical protein